MCAAMMPSNSATSNTMAAQSMHPIQSAFAYSLHSGHNMRMCLNPTFSAPLSLQCLHYQRVLSHGRKVAREATQWDCSQFSKLTLARVKACHTQHPGTNRMTQ